jgi:hypothetical protein
MTFLSLLCALHILCFIIIIIIIIQRQIVWWLINHVFSEESGCSVIEVQSRNFSKATEYNEYHQAFFRGPGKDLNQAPPNE